MSGYSITPALRPLVTYTVRVMKKYPAWNEREGWTLTIKARSKAEAIRHARRDMADAGHTGPGCGPAYFSAFDVGLDTL